MIDQDVRLGPRIRAGAVSALCGTLLACQPPTLPADTAAKRWADRMLPRTGWSACLYFVGVAGLWVGYSNLAGSAGLAVATLASLAGGAWCSVNFWRCRHAHCVVTGAGWLALAVLAAVEALLGRSLIGGYEGVVFLGVLAAGVLFEFGWYLAAGTQAVTSRNAHRSASAGVPLAKQDVGPRP